MFWCLPSPPTRAGAMRKGHAILLCTSQVRSLARNEFVRNSPTQTYDFFLNVLFLFDFKVSENFQPFSDCGCAMIATRSRQRALLRRALRSAPWPTCADVSNVFSVFLCFSIDQNFLCWPVIVVDRDVHFFLFRGDRWGGDDVHDTTCASFASTTCSIPVNG